MKPEDIAQRVALLAQLTPEQRGAAISAMAGGLDHHLGLRFTWCAEDRVVATLEVLETHTQVYGLTHGGVYCAMVEAVGSCGAALLWIGSGNLPVGIENRTRFRKGTRVGTTLTAIGEPRKDNGHTAIWDVRVLDGDGVLCAEGELHARALAPGAKVAGQTLTVPG